MSLDKLNNNSSQQQLFARLSSFIPGRTIRFNAIQIPEIYNPFLFLKNNAGCANNLFAFVLNIGFIFNFYLKENTLDLMRELSLYKKQKTNTTANYE